MTREPSYKTIVSEFNNFILENMKSLDPKTALDPLHPISKKWRELTNEYVDFVLTKFNKGFGINEQSKT